MKRIAATIPTARMFKLTLELLLMLITENTISFQGTLQSAWDKLVDWKKMHEWDPFLERLHFAGPMRLGSIGRLKMKGGPEVAVKVTSFNAPYAYTDEFSMLGSTFTFHHELQEKSPGEISLRIAVEARGFLAELLCPLMKKEFADKMPLLMSSFTAQYRGMQK